MDVRGVILIVFAVAARAQDASAVAKAADEAVAAFEASDAAALDALAARPGRPDPWLVADALLAQQRRDVAAAFATAVPAGKDVERLGAYVAARDSTDGAGRKALGAVLAALDAERYEAALDALPDGARDDPFLAVRFWFCRGRALASLRRYGESAAAYRSAAEGAAGLGWLARAADAWKRAAVSCTYARDGRGAARCWQTAIEVERARANTAGVAYALAKMGFIQLRTGELARGKATLEEALRLQEATDAPPLLVADTLASLGDAARRTGRTADALALLERATTYAEESGDSRILSRVHALVGMTHYARSDFDRAASYMQRAYDIMKKDGRDAEALKVLGNIGVVHYVRGDYDRALTTYEEVIAAQRKAGNDAGIAKMEASIGLVLNERGRHAEALERLVRALEIERRLENRVAEAQCLNNIGIVRFARAEYPNAIRAYEAALAIAEPIGDRPLQAITLGNLGDIQLQLGNYEDALRLQLRALALKEEMGDRRAVAMSLGNIGSNYARRHDWSNALAYYEKSLALRAELGDKPGIANVLGNMATAYGKQGDLERAYELHSKALALRRELGETSSVAHSLGNMAAIHEERSQWDKARPLRTEALALARELDDPYLELTQLRGLALLQLHIAELGAASSTGRAAVTALRRLAGGLGQEEGATLRSEFEIVFAIGAEACLRSSDLAGLAFFLESGRAGSLLEALGGAEAIGAVALPDELVALEKRALERERTALAEYRETLRRGKRKRAKWLRQELKNARAERRAAVARIQREAKAVAQVAYPEAAPLDALRASVREGEALVLFGRAREHMLALVVTPEGARAVTLAAFAPVEEAFNALRDGLREGKDIETACASLRAAIWKPLGIGPATRRLLVSPFGPLSYVPFVLLDGSREVVHVPSGTAYGRLRERAAPRGTGVLGVADPDYTGTQLARLPATRAEVEAVATERLLGGRATEAGLRAALARPERWRAVHLACHGLVDPNRPTQSSLALTADEEDDGLLSVLDIFGMKVPADLAVLSACDTGRGRVLDGEGVVGFTQAFLLAGAPRVIVSLWKVDDQATRALMEEFYRQWRNHPAATALRKAQEHVAAQEKWRHPYFWAAWQLWGLGD